ncbi:hypothetical protein CLOM_g19020 [Closterium sp. NIES-68]|nr:hypothetical protein CLOM_g19020 [Closterium sp. NIES-68]
MTNRGRRASPGFPEGRQQRRSIGNRQQEQSQRREQRQKCEQRQQHQQQRFTASRSKLIPIRTIKAVAGGGVSWKVVSAARISEDSPVIFSTVSSSSSAVVLEASLRAVTSAALDQPRIAQFPPSSSEATGNRLSAESASWLTRRQPSHRQSYDHPSQSLSHESAIDPSHDKSVLITGGNRRASPGCRSVSIAAVLDPTPGSALIPPWFTLWFARTLLLVKPSLPSPSVTSRPVTSHPVTCHHFALLRAKSFHSGSISSEVRKSLLPRVSTRLCI